MNSRQKILAGIKKSLTVASEMPEEYKVESELFQNIENTVPDTPAALKQQFKEALLAVSAQYLEFKSIQDLYTAVNFILQQKKTKSFVIPGTLFTRMIADELCKSHKDLECISAVQEQDEQRVRSIETIPVSIVDCMYAVADTGTLCVSFTNKISQLPYILPPTVIAVVKQDQLIANHTRLFQKLTLNERKSMILITGASRTADIEKILFLGAHGPRDLIVCLVESD